MHPLEPIKNKMGWTWGDVASRIREKNGTPIPSRDQLAQIICGRRISPKMASMIHLAFPRVSILSLLYYEREAESMTSKVITCQVNKTGGKKTAAKK